MQRERNPATNRKSKKESQLWLQRRIMTEIKFKFKITRLNDPRQLIINFKFKFKLKNNCV
jgi:hypothetical protein